MDKRFADWLLNQRFSVRICPVCKRNDRFSPLGRTQHWTGGNLCPGTPIDVELLPVAVDD